MPTSDSGIPLIATNCIKSDKLYPVYENVRYVSDEIFQNWFRSHPLPDDVIFVNKGTPGLVCMIPDPVDFCIAQDMVALRSDPSIMDTKFLYACLDSHIFQSQVKNTSVGTMIPHLKKGDFVNLWLPVPPIKESSEIGNLIFNIDYYSHHSNRIINSISDLISALFRSWFIDFEPVKAKAEGKLPYGMDEETAALFPDTFEDSKFGEIPEGWEIKKLDSIIDYKEGPGIRNWQYVYDGKGTNFINIRCIKNGDLDISTANQISNEEAYGKYSHFHLQENDVVISTSGTLGRYAVVRKEHLPLVLNTSVIRLRPKDNCNLSFLLGYVETGLQNELQALASGSVQLNFGPMHLRIISLIYPPISILNAYEKAVNKLLTMNFHLQTRRNTLSNLRYVLLPKLMSGELSVS